MWVLPDGSESTVCPAQLVLEEHSELLSYHAHYQRGVLPVAGGLLDQTAFFVDAMNAIDKWIAEAQRRRSKR